MKTKPYNAAIRASSLLLLLVLAGCQSTAGKPAADAPARKSTADAPARKSTAITFDSDADMLSALLRQAGPMIHKGGVVIMNGSGRIVIAPQEFKGLGTNSFANALAQAGNLELATTPHYEFLYPKGYEVLLDTDFSFSGPLADKEASASFGDGTRLYNACAILSQSLGVSIVADNVVADIMCGEVVMRAAPLAAVVEALLRSARATDDAVHVEGTGEYIFLRAATNTSPPDALLNSGPLTAQQEAFLGKRVNIFLPEGANRTGATVFVEEAFTLGKLLKSLERQLGVPVRAQEALLALPVNYTVLNGVTARTALNLIVRQWPVDKFGFALEGDGVLLTSR